MVLLGYRPVGRVILGSEFSGYKLKYFEAGTSTEKTTYTDSALTGGNENTNPVVLDALGAAQIWFDGDAKVTFSDADDALVYTDDNINVGDAVSDVLRNYIGGLILSRDAGDPSNDINITAGDAVDSTGAEKLSLTSEITKQIDAAWAAGDDAGGLFSGSVAVSTWYHVFIIQKDSDGSIEAGFDTSVIAANIPTGYTKFRRIGSVLTDGSVVLTPFSQNGREFIWDVPVVDFATTNPGTSAVLETLSVPPGVKVRANCSVDLVDDSPATATGLLITDPDQTDSSPTTRFDLQIRNAGAGVPQTANMRAYFRTDTSQQIRYRIGTSTADHDVTMFTHGWIED